MGNRDDDQQREVNDDHPSGPLSPADRLEAWLRDSENARRCRQSIEHAATGLKARDSHRARGAPLLTPLPEPRHPGDQGRLLNLSRDDPHQLYGAGGGPRPSEALRGDRRLTDVQLAEDFAASLIPKLDSITGQRDAVLRMQFTPAQAAFAKQLFTRLRERSMQLTELETRLAYARLIYLESPGDQRSKAVRALRLLLGDLPPKDRRTSLIDRRSLVTDFRMLIEHQGAVTLWKPMEAKLDLPGRVVANCPLTPDAAVGLLTHRYGFQSRLACLRFLQRERRRRERAALDDPLTLESDLQALRKLPPEPHRKR